MFEILNKTVDMRYESKNINIKLLMVIRVAALGML